MNREVEIRPSLPGESGERTDLMVEARVPESESGDDVVSAIIEVKGCWHSDVLTALHQQLAERYLDNIQVSAGIYLVGWFQCDQWDAADYRKSQTPGMTLDEARAFFEQQARDACTQDRTVRSVVLDISLGR